jgi:hypothetical protein
MPPGYSDPPAMVMGKPKARLCGVLSLVFTVPAALMSWLLLLINKASDEPDLGIIIAVSSAGVIALALICLTIYFAITEKPRLTPKFFDRDTGCFLIIHPSKKTR